MAIEKKLIHFGKLADFETQLTAGNILNRSIVFIQDAKKIWTHGTYYDCSESVSPDADNVYITDFTVNDLENVIGSGTDVVADLTSLEEALAAHKVVLVPYNADDGYLGCGLLLGYAEDLLYCTVYVGGFDGLFYEIEATRGDTFIRDQSILKRTWSDLQDRLVSGTNIKTINGTSILGIGNIEIESGEDNVQSDWNVTDTSSDAYIKHKPTIPTKTSHLTNDSNFLDKDTADGSYVAVEKFGEIDFVAQAQALDDRVMLYAFPTSATGDEDDVIATKNTLKTINGESILGEGDLTVEGGAKVYTWNWDGSESGTLTQEEYDGIVGSDTIIISSEDANLQVLSKYILFGTIILNIDLPRIDFNSGDISAKKANVILKSDLTYSIQSLFEYPSNGIELLKGYNIQIVGESEGGLKCIDGTYDAVFQLVDSPTKIYINGIQVIPYRTNSALIDLIGLGFSVLDGNPVYIMSTLQLTNNDILIPSNDIPIVTQDSLPTKTSQLENDSNFVSSDGLKTINGESIVGSGDITISGGSSSGGSGAYSEVNHGTADTTFTLTPNTFHVWDEVASLTLDFGSETSGVANEFLFQFTSGATATTLTLPDDIKWANDSAPTIEANMIYQVSVLKGLASVLEFSNAAPVVLITFYYSGSPYSAEEGMTWEQWCNSTYNSTTLMISGGVLTINGVYRVYNSSGMLVYGTDVIIENEYYDMGQSGGES